jgi:hypothetical protein
MQLLTGLAPRIAWHPFKYAVRGASRYGILAIERIIGTVASYPKVAKEV